MCLPPAIARAPMDSRLLICAECQRFLAGIGDAAFDAVIASMSLMDVEDYDGSIREVNRVPARRRASDERTSPARIQRVGRQKYLAASWIAGQAMRVRGFEMSGLVFALEHMGKIHERLLISSSGE